MKDFAKVFVRRYNAVKVEEAEDIINNIHGSPNIEKQQQQQQQQQQQRHHKSLKVNHNMKPINILSTFFNDRQDHRCRSPKCAFLLLAFGVIAVSIAALVRTYRPYDLIFKWKLQMSENGEIFNLWAKPPVDLYIKIYLFNITNAEAFLEGRERLRVEQVGPYVYKEILTHENVTFNENKTMSTIPSHPLIWQQELSGQRREDDEVIMVNIAMLAIAHLTAPRNFVMRMMLNTLFATSKSDPIVRMTAREFMFGYPTSLAKLGNTFLPGWISFDSVGLIDRMYDFSTDFETFYTGVPDPAISGLYATYRGEKNLPQWDGEHCSNIEYASDGTKFKSFLQQNESVKFFRKSMCRPIHLHRVGEARTFGSLKGYDYVFEENALDNGRINKANKCFCREGNCQPVGLLDVSDCYYGFPISLSYPHFLHGDMSLQDNITGIQADTRKHSSAFVIQPESGLPLSLSVKVQINMHFKDMSAFKQLRHFSHLTVPMLWFDITMPELPKELDSRFNFYLNLLPWIEPIGFWGGLIIGILLLAYAITRAILHMSGYVYQAPISSTTDGKYLRANLLQSRIVVSNESVYTPCETSLHLDKSKKDSLLTDTEDNNIKTTIMKTDKEVQQTQQHSLFALGFMPVSSYSYSANEEDPSQRSQQQSLPSNNAYNGTVSAVKLNENQQF